MSKKMKVFTLLIIGIIVLVGFCKCYGILTEAENAYGVDENYTEITEENRSNLQLTKGSVFTAYECGLLVNWNYTINGFLYEVRTPKGEISYWSKEAIAEFIFNSRETKYFK